MVRRLAAAFAYSDASWMARPSGRTYPCSKRVRKVPDVSFRCCAGWPRFHSVRFVLAMPGPGLLLRSSFLVLPISPYPTLETLSYPFPAAEVSLVDDSQSSVAHHDVIAHSTEL